MQTNKLLVFTLLIALMSCGQNEENNLSVLTTLTGDSGISYNESLDEWSLLKSKNGNSYIYQTTFTSWAGFGNTTELKIKKGVVTSRSYEAFEYNQTDGSKTITSSYIENDTDLGSHEMGAGLLTIDDLYESCANKYLIVDAKTNRLYFETEIDGLMTLCGFVPNNCADDCFTGVSISSFEWII